MSIIAEKIPVLEQRMVRVTVPDDASKENPLVFNIERLKEKSYTTSVTKFKKMGERDYDVTRTAAAKRYGKGKLGAMSVREEYWATREIQRRAAYGADIPGSCMRKDLEVL